jgi:hypothetical protein
MALSLALSSAEFASLATIASGPLLGFPIPSAHLLKLAGMKYIVVVVGGYDATATGLLRIASGC